jgi:hypothetical protein
MVGSLVLLCAGLLPAADDPAKELLPPVRLEAAGKPIDTAIGHAAPCAADFDGDGVMDLLVGQFGDGLLWIYRNEGTNARPKLAAGVKFKDGNKDGRVPTG